MRLVIVVFVCLLASVAFAQIDPVPDGIGIYADLETPYWLHYFQGDDGQPVFAVNGELTPAEAYSWSSVKAMF